jgi:hypothetical protein
MYFSCEITSDVRLRADRLMFLDVINGLLASGDKDL